LARRDAKLVLDVTDEQRSRRQTTSYFGDRTLAQVETGRRFALRSEIVIVLELGFSSLMLKSDCCETTVNGAQRFAKPKERPPGRTEDEDELEDDNDYLL
jgi:hypothetical protein